MPLPWAEREHHAFARHAARWTLLAVPVSLAIGSVCALFLWSLDRVTRTRDARPGLLFLLPLAGVGIVWVYRRFGGEAGRGNDLILDEIHEPRGGVPLRMTPLVLVATLVTHLFGGSAGREGTAVQIGGSLAGAAGRRLKLPPADVATLLMVGIAAGFGGVFGTPLAGAVFAAEVLTIGRLRYEAIVPCLIGAIAGDVGCTAWGVRHTAYPVDPGSGHFEWLLAGKIALASVAFGLASVLFAELTHALGRAWKTLVRAELLRPVLGAGVVIGLTFLLGTRDYLGLGVTAPEPGGVSIVSSFRPGGADPLSWWWKILFTAVTLSCGFKGGEVTPLFFIGATLGNVLAGPLGAPADLFAALGFVAVFAGATNTPLACTIMGAELFGAGHGPYLAIACFVAYLASGRSGIYAAQRVGTSPGTLANAHAAPASPDVPRTAAAGPLRHAGGRAGPASTTDIESSPAD